MHTSGKEILMSYTFQSGLAQELQSMIDYKVSLGYSETSYLARSASLDRYCMKYFPEITQLTQDVAIGWLERHPNESPSWTRQLYSRSGKISEIHGKRGLCYS
jgi:hypothetical protein